MALSLRQFCVILMAGSEPMIRFRATGLSEAERDTLTFRRLRLERLELVSGEDGIPVERAARYVPGDRTTAPTVEALCQALARIGVQVGSSSWRAFEAGKAEPRLTISRMAELAAALGLSADELVAVTRNTMREAVASKP